MQGWDQLNQTGYDFKKAIQLFHLTLVMHGEPTRIPTLPSEASEQLV